MKYEIKWDQKQQRRRVVDGDGLGPVRIGIAIFSPAGEIRGENPHPFKKLPKMGWFEGFGPSVPNSDRE